MSPFLAIPIRWPQYISSLLTYPFALNTKCQSCYKNPNFLRMVQSILLKLSTCRADSLFLETMVLIFVFIIFLTKIVTFLRCSLLPPYFFVTTTIALVFFVFHIKLVYLAFFLLFDKTLKEGVAFWGVTLYSFILYNFWKDKTKTKIWKNY